MIPPGTGRGRARSHHHEIQTPIQTAKPWIANFSGTASQARGRWSAWIPSRLLHGGGHRQVSKLVRARSCLVSTLQRPELFHRHLSADRCARPLVIFLTKSRRSNDSEDPSCNNHRARREGKPAHLCSRSISGLQSFRRRKRCNKRQLTHYDRLAKPSRLFLLLPRPRMFAVRLIRTVGSESCCKGRSLVRDDVRCFSLRMCAQRSRGLWSLRVHLRRWLQFRPLVERTLRVKLAASCFRSLYWLSRGVNLSRAVYRQIVRRWAAPLQRRLSHVRSSGKRRLQALVSCRVWTTRRQTSLAAWSLAVASRFRSFR